MAIKHLYHSGRFTEILMSGYTTLFGTWIISSVNRGTPALSWTGLSIENQMLVGAMFAAFGVVHAAGVRINGSWWASPFLRVAGMIGASGATAVLATSAENPMSSATFTYGFIFFWYVIASVNAMRDSALALGVRRDKQNAGIV